MLLRDCWSAMYWPHPVQWPGTRRDLNLVFLEHYFKLFMILSYTTGTLVSEQIQSILFGDSDIRVKDPLCRTVSTICQINSDYAWAFLCITCHKKVVYVFATTWQTLVTAVGQYSAQVLYFMYVFQCKVVLVNFQLSQKFHKLLNDRWQCQSFLMDLSGTLWWALDFHLLRIVRVLGHIS